MMMAMWRGSARPSRKRSRASSACRSASAPRAPPSSTAPTALHRFRSRVLLISAMLDPSIPHAPAPHVSTCPHVRPAAPVLYRQNLVFLRAPHLVQIRDVFVRQLLQLVGVALQVVGGDLLLLLLVTQVIVRVAADV